MAAVLRNGPVGVDKKTICLSFCDGLRRAGAWTAEIRSYGDRKTMTGLPSLALRV
jgi:nucleoside-triphosphatase THEP1